MVRIVDNGVSRLTETKILALAFVFEAKLPLLRDKLKKHFQNEEDNEKVEKASSTTRAEQKKDYGKKISVCKTEKKKD